MATPKKSLYEILGVPRDASAADIDAAYDRRRAEVGNAGSTDASEVAMLRDARDMLRDPKRRAAYDASLAAAEQREAAAARDPGPVELVEVEPRRGIPWIPIGIVVAVLLVIVVALARPHNKPETEEKHAEAAPGTMAAAPPPQVIKKTGPEIIAEASTSGGQVLSYSMSGQSIPIGLAVSTDGGSMITTCHGIPAGAKLVVRVQGQSYPADLVLTDEVLDLCKLQLANFGTAPVTIAPGEAKAGDRVFAVGVDLAGKFAATEGTIKRVLDTTEGRLYELSMPVGEFSSGGGVFDDQARLVGISTFQHRSGLSIAYPATWIGQMKSRQEPPPAAPATPAAPK